MYKIWSHTLLTETSERKSAEADELEERLAEKEAEASGYRHGLLAQTTLDD